MEKELKYIKTYSANLHVQHSTLFGLLILEKWKLTKPFIDFLFFKIFFLYKNMDPITVSVMCIKQKCTLKRTLVATFMTHLPSL